MDLLLTVVLGLALTFALAVLFGQLAEGRVPALPRRVDALWSGADGVSAAVALLLTAAGLALLPWPLHPASDRALVGHPLVVWCALEGAFLAPLLPGLLAPSPLAARAVVREAQVSVAGRAVVWLAIGTALSAGGDWTPAALPGHALALLGGLLALPAAAGLGPFAPERSLSPAGAEEGLDEDTARLLRFARSARGAALTAALCLAALLPVSMRGPDDAPLPAALVTALAAFALVTFALGRYALGRPRSTLPAALRWCWWRALPLALAGLVYLAFISV